MRKLFYVILALNCLGLPASAWNNVGHRAIAELVWRQMNPEQRRAATDLLKQHPHYKQLLADKVPADVGTDEWVFLTAAVWPDLVRPAKAGQPHKPRSITKYDVYPHAIGYPFVRPSESNEVSTAGFFIAKPNAEMVLSNSLATFKNKTASAHDRAVALSAVLHLVGDLHQPLHAANLVTKDKPRGDDLGGSHIIMDPRAEPSRKRTNMHSFWDQLPGVNPSYRSITALADELTAAPELKVETLKEYREHKTIAAWVQESFRYAVDFAYAEDRLQFVHSDALDSGKVSEAAIPILKADYIAEARKIACRRLVLAAQRLSDELKPAW